MLYVNGDSHAAGAEAVNTCAFAQDDPGYHFFGRRPHPANLSVSFGKLIADKLNLPFYCDAESGSSNQRILRTTHSYLNEQTPTFVLIGWSTWEREEVEVDGELHQFSAGLILDCWPPVSQKVKDTYKKWILSRNDESKFYADQHDKIYKLHIRLKTLNIPHLFFNSFSAIRNVDPVDWGQNYIAPYNDDSFTYYHWLRNQGLTTVSPTSYHYGPDGHKKWAEFLLPYVNDLLNKNVNN